MKTKSEIQATETITVFERKDGTFGYSDRGYPETEKEVFQSAYDAAIAAGLNPEEVQGVLFGDWIETTE